MKPPDNAGLQHIEVSVGPEVQAERDSVTHVYPERFNAYTVNHDSGVLPTAISLRRIGPGQLLSP